MSDFVSGGFIASCRVRASYVREHAALGGISLALKLGEAIIAAEGMGGAQPLAGVAVHPGAHGIHQTLVTRPQA